MKNYDNKYMKINKQVNKKKKPQKKQRSTYRKFFFRQKDIFQNIF